MPYVAFHSVGETMEEGIKSIAFMLSLKSLGTCTHTVFLDTTVLS